MGLSDPHDPRTFTHFAKLNADGSVAAIVEVADTALQHFDPSADGHCYVNVTELRKTRVNLFALSVKPETVQKALANNTQRDDRFSLEHEFRTAFARAIPDALVKDVFGAVDTDGGG